MANRTSLTGYSSVEISNLRKRGPKLWQWIDWVLSESNQNQNLKKDVVLKLIDKILPSKIEGNLNLSGEYAYAQNVFNRLGIPLELNVEGHEPAIE